jgi:acetyltransferase-like isoleucine patch superfamily enzyme
VRGNKNMINKMLNKIISKIKKEPYEIDKEITSVIMLSILKDKFFMIFRGVFHKILLKKSIGILFIGSKVKIRCHRKINFLGSATIEDNCKIDALSKKGITIGSNFSLGRNGIIECTGVIRELGEELVIGENVGIAANAFISVRGKVEIGNNTICGPNLSIHAENHNYKDVNIPIRLQGATRKGIKIGEDCWIGTNVTILDGVTIGDKSIIAAGAVITKDIPDLVIAGGIPAQIIKERMADNG